ncbi:AAA family ATPase [Cytophagaceae bacterium YF14B1]|uniref:AAA family ATPase n=1 Tax=Xanthocytophaga flava TaxID=3048013 RepID=A0AAE3QTB2_9BACT|nr:AAA family ATPase [Xanthocytophaga flavus]MDJ1482454.1 AAA family ATPase [Xanthocytophaga flavus]
MYIQKVSIKNIRSIQRFEMEFENPAGWHVLIGDNGAGKSSIIRSIALGLVGPEEILGIKPNWNNWITWKEDNGSVELGIEPEEGIDSQDSTSGIGRNFTLQLNFRREPEGNVFFDTTTGVQNQVPAALWKGKEGWFSAGYGPFRRFSGGSTEMEKVFENPGYTRLASHLSLFGEDVALTEATRWLVTVNYKMLEQRANNATYRDWLEDLKRLINSTDFLPHNTSLLRISSDGVVFKDGNGAEISVMQMSDGYRSILSLTLELIRQMVRVYGEDKVFKDIREDKMIINLPGVVLIDEVDAHLHPTWQTRIGQWFTKYFPKLQFIVTSHSPLVCRAAEKGSIWRLAAPGSGNESGPVTGLNREKLIYGNILDAYGTEVFGASPVRSAESDKMLETLGKLNMLSAFGKLSEEEEKQRIQLQQILATDDPTGL